MKITIGRKIKRYEIDDNEFVMCRDDATADMMQKYDDDNVFVNKSENEKMSDDTGRKGIVYILNLADQCEAIHCTRTKHFCGQPTWA